MNCKVALGVNLVSQQHEFKHIFKTALDCKGSSEERLLGGCQHLFCTKCGPQTSDNTLNTK